MPHDRFRPFEAKPAEILIYPGLKFRPRPAAIQILYPEQKHAPGGAGGVGGRQRGKGMAEMKPPCRGGRETFNMHGRRKGQHHGFVKAGLDGASPGVHLRSMKIIETEADIDEGVTALKRACPLMAKAIEAIGRPPLRRRSDGFDALLQVIVGQQVSTAAAAGIWAKMEEAGLTTEEAVRRASETELRAAGLSRPKARYAAELANAALDYEALRDLPEAEAIALMTNIPGVGRWTAEIYLMFSVGRADIFAPGDLALREAVRELFNMEQRPTIAELDEIAKRWKPWRAVAARVLFAYYRIIKGREGVI